MQTPLLDMRIRRLDRSVNRVAMALVFAALLVAGAILFPTEPTLARILMAASALPLLRAMMGGRGGHPGRR